MINAFTTKATKTYQFTDPNGNPAEIEYKSRMSLGDEVQLQEKYTQMQVNTSNGRNGQVNVQVSLKRQKLELLIVNIKRWRGKWFQNAENKILPPVRKNIENLTSEINDYWIDALCELIAESNKPLEAPITTERDIEELKKTADMAEPST